MLVLAKYNLFFQSLVRTVPGAGLYFGIVHNLQLAVGGKEKALSFRTNLMIGTISRAGVAMILLPITVLKARAEVCIISKN